MATLLGWSLVGVVLRATGIDAATTARDLTRLVLGLTLPCLVFAAVHAASPTRADLVLPALAWGMSIAALAGGDALARALKLPPARAGAFVLALAFGNTTYLGYPIVGGLFPPPQPQLALAILFDQLGATFAVTTLGAAYAGLASGRAPSVRQLATRLLVFPPLWALALGFLLHGLALPPAFASGLMAIGGFTVPLMLVTLGLAAPLAGWREGGGLVLAIAAVKLVAMPLAVFAAVTALGLPAPHRQAAVLEAAMPTMFYALALAVACDLDAALVGRAIVATTAASAIALPCWIALVR